MVTKILILAFIFLLPMIPTFWAIVDVANRPFRDFQTKVIWFAIVTLMPVIGALIYFFYGRKKYTRNIDTVDRTDGDKITSQEDKR